MRLSDIWENLLKGESKEKTEKQIPSLDDWDNDDTNFFEDDGGRRWFAPTLWTAAENKPIKSIPLLNLFDPDEWKRDVEGESADILENEFSRIARADLSFPIILTPDGEICDGFHRAMKAYLLKHKKIMAIQLEEMPEPDEIVDASKY